MRLIGKLVWAQFRGHWIRTLLALSAVVTSVAMVVVIIGGQTATMAQVDTASAKPLGEYEVILQAGSAQDVTGEGKRIESSVPLPGFEEGTLTWVEKHPDVTGVMELEAMTGETSLRAGRGRRRSATRAGAASRPVVAKAAASEPARRKFTSMTPGFVAPSSVLILGTNATAAPRTLSSGTWLSAGVEDGVVLDANVARRFGRKVGEAFLLSTIMGKHRTKVVGIMETPIVLRGLTGIYAGPRLMGKLSGKVFAANRMYVGLKETASAEVFAGQFAEYLATHHEAAQVENVKALLEVTAAHAVPHQSGVWFFPLVRDGAVKLAIVAAMFIIFNTFSMGVQERTRQLAMLRAVGMTRSGTIATLLAESMSVAFVGWLGGMAIGWWVLNGSLHRGRGGLQIHLDLDVGRLFLLGAITAFGAVLVATVLPAALAARKRPLDGMSGSPMLSSQRAPWWLTVLGLVLIVLNPLAAFTSVFPDPMRTNVIVPISFVAALAGFVMVTPFLLTITEPVFVQISARLLALNPRLLQRHLSSNLWRTVGCVAAMMVGLGLYMVVHIWGQSMAVPFLMTQVPDAVVLVSPNGVPADKTAALEKLPGVTSADPIMLEHPVLADLPSYVSYTGIEFFSKDMLYLGCDLHKLVDGKEGMFHGIFVRGNEADADKLLAQGDACLITDNLWRRVPEKYDVGKTIAVTTENFPHKLLTYKIAGVVQMDGWHQFSQRTRMRRNMGRVGGMIMVPRATAMAAYPGDTFKTLWFKLDAGTKPASLEAEIRPLVERSGGPIYFETIDTRLLAGVQRERIQSMINSIAYYPLWALVLASVAVVNTLFTSIRARSWEIGILRSIGQTRGQIVRQVLAEGILIGLLACAVSLLFALLASKAGIIAGTRTMDVAAPYVLPWEHLGMGVGLAMGVCIIASVMPAFLAARKEPLRLLQLGRAME